MGKKIRTRFPMARIKKIMQSDEDVGKVAQATPVLISKTLELFLQKLVESTVARAQAKGGRVLTVAHLKQCVSEESHFDFLNEIVQKVPDMPAEESGTPSTKRSKARRLSSSTASVMSSQEDGDEDEDDDIDSDDDDDDDEEEEERKPKKPPVKKQRKAPAPKKQCADQSAPHGKQTTIVSPSKQKEEGTAPVVAGSDDRPAAAAVAVQTGFIATSIVGTKVQAMDDDYDDPQ